MSSSLPLSQFLPDNLFAVFLVFARLGSAMLLLPGFGEIYVPQRYRLLLALFMSALLTPVLAPLLPPLPASPSRLAVVVGTEVVIGVFIGTVARMFLAALETAGMLISLQLGLSNAAMFNPLAEEQQSPIPSSLYAMLGVLLIFLTGMHHLLLRAAVDSYDVFAPGRMPPIADLVSVIAHTAAGSFRLAIELAAPFIVLGTVFFVALGLIARMVPQLQVLFVAQPFQIIGGLVVFAAVMGAGMHWFLHAFAQQMSFLLPS